MFAKSSVAAAAIAAGLSGAALAHDLSVPDPGAPGARAPFSDPAARAYLRLPFAGAAEQPRSLQFGLRLDSHSSGAWMHREALARMSFSDRGFDNLRLNGVPLLEKHYRRNQNGEDELHFGVIDWGLLALAAGGIGYLAFELADSERDSDSPRIEDGDDGGNGDGGGGGGDGGGGGLLGGLLGGLGGGQLTEAASRRAPVSQREMDAWLDGGNGQMGDLEPAR